MFNEKKPMFQELTDSELDQVTGGNGLLGTVGQTLNTVTSTVPGVKSLVPGLPHTTTGESINAETPVASVNVTLGTDLGL
ncbi:bacteriocin [Ktedonospora formicarum]|uniref:Bacteriocin n=1 Tax=Ktedonospora formicarum TaxID=2778364 RepID=A0A8J3MSW2_9CHLR|nr:bacteriocin [Ktedonospora formicarum]GHO43745.1 hypothetical protein KSX_19080 [Ktedonospora formicarum]